MSTPFLFLQAPAGWSPRASSACLMGTWMGCELRKLSRRIACHRSSLFGALRGDQVSGLEYARGLGWSQEAFRRQARSFQGSASDKKDCWEGDSHQMKITASRIARTIRSKLLQEPRPWFHHFPRAPGPPPFPRWLGWVDLGV